MLKFKSYPLELRGIASKISSKDKLYYILNVESDDGSPHSLYCPSDECFPSGLKKGEMIYVTCEVIKFGKEDRLVVAKVERVQ